MAAKGLDRWRGAVVLLLLFPAFMAGAAQAADVDLAMTAEPGVEIHRMIAGFEGAMPPFQPGEFFHGGEVVRADDGLAFVVVKTSDPAAFRARAMADDRIRYVEDDGTDRLSFTPNDSRWSNQYGPQQVRAPDAWDLHMGTATIKVCVVDSGIRAGHEDLTGPRYLGGYNYVSGNSNNADDNGHGTHVTGTIAATTENSRGIAGLAQVSFYHVKSFRSDGSGTHGDLASGVRWCADRGAHVISMSFGGVHSTTKQSAMDYAYGKGALLVAAAGNSGPCSNCVEYPAKYSNVVAVTCTTSSEAECNFSSDGAESEFAAPGYSIISTCHSSNTAYCYGSGTSMSAPHVAGVAALVWSAGPELTRDELRTLLQGTARDKGAAGRDAIYGYGIPDAREAIDNIGGPNGLPIANAGPDQVVLDGDGSGSEPVTLDASGSSDPDGIIVSYQWKKGGTLVATGASPTVDLALGHHELTLTVEDNRRGIATDTVVIDVIQNYRPEAAFTFSGRASDPDGDGVETITLDGSASTDADGTISLYEWFDGGAFIGSGTVIASQMAIGSHSIRLRVTDDDGDFGEAIRTVAIAPNRVPIADAGPDTTASDDNGDGIESITLSGSASSDDGTIVDYAWSQDGTLLATGREVTLPFPIGTHALVLDVTDNLGETARDDIVVAVLSNTPPKAAFTYRCEGTSCTLDATASSDAGDGPLAASWQFGDGATSAAMVAPHEYGAPDSYVVRLTITDAGGLTDSTTRTVYAGVPLPPPATPPASPHVPDRYGNPIFDSGIYAAHLNIESAWFDTTPDFLQVGLKVQDIYPDRNGASSTGFNVRFMPAWAVEDPTWNGAVPAGKTFLGLQVTYAFEPYQYPTRILHETAQLGAVWQDGDDLSVVPIASIGVDVDAVTSIIWWSVPRTLLQEPPTGSWVTKPEAYVDLWIGAGVLEWGGLDRTGVGFDFQLN